MRLSQQANWIAVTLLFVFTSACDPPGQPGSQSEELAAPTDFKILFAENCSGCHGNFGRQGPGRVLNDPLYLAFAPKETIRQVLIHGRAGTLMPAWAKSEGGPLDDAQISSLVDGMQTNWKKPFDPHGAAIPSYDGAGFTGDVASGKKLFARNCFACHAPGGVAGPINVATYLSLSSNQNLRTSIVVGRPDFPKIQMPNYTLLNSGHALADQDVADLVTYLSSVRPPSSAMAKAEMQRSNPSAVETSPMETSPEVKH